MAMVEYRSGCKVAWETYDDEHEAIGASNAAKVEAERKAGLGYDFGFQWPGSIQHVENHPTHGEVWIVCLP
jgi:hypothetical protein